MDFLISILLNSVILIVTAKALPKVHVDGWGSALIAALLIGIFSPTIGWILNGLLHVATLGVFFLLGLGFIIRLITTAIILKLVDWLMRGLKIDSFGTAFLIAIIMALAGTLIEYLL